MIRDEILLRFHYGRLSSIFERMLLIRLLWLLYGSILTTNTFFLEDAECLYSGCIFDIAFLTLTIPVRLFLIV